MTADDIGWAVRLQALSGLFSMAKWAARPSMGHEHKLFARVEHMSEIDHLPAVRQGQWFFAGMTACPVRIVQHHTLFGTHDPEDPPALAADQPTACFYIRYQPPGAQTEWRDGGVALSLREAVFMAQRKLGPVLQWTEADAHH